MFSYAKKILSIIGIGLLAGCAASGPTISTPVRPGAAVAVPAYQNGDHWGYQMFDRQATTINFKSAIAMGNLK